MRWTESGYEHVVILLKCESLLLYGEKWTQWEQLGLRWSQILDHEWLNEKRLE